MSEREEKKNQRVGLLTSVGIHFGLLALFLFAMGWSAPNPPLSEYGSGVELNFGLDDQGSGDIQTLSPVGDNTKSAEEKKEDASPKQEVQKEAQKPEDTKPEKQLTSQDDSPVEVKETKKDIKKDPIKDSSPEDKKQTETKKEDGKAANNTEVKKTSEDPGKNASDGHSQGDDKNKKGDKGSPEGSLDPNGQYTGKPGSGGNGSGGNGFGLQMAGWNWDAPPQAPRLPDNENGRIVFEIVVDANGEIMKIETLERGLSPEAEKLCKEEIQKRSLIRTSGGTAPEQSKGRITFILKTR